MTLALSIAVVVVVKPSQVSKIPKCISSTSGWIYLPLENATKADKYYEFFAAST